METLLISLISVAIVIVATVTMTISTFSSAVRVTDSWASMEKQVEEIRHTSIVASPPDNYAGGDIILMVGNDGQTDVGDFSHWDIMAESQTGSVQYLDYVVSMPPGANQWALDGIFMSDNTSAPEVFASDVLNPFETARFVLNLNPAIGSGQSVRIKASTPNGVTAQCILTRQ